MSCELFDMLTGPVLRAVLLLVKLQLPVHYVIREEMENSTDKHRTEIITDCK